MLCHFSWWRLGSPSPWWQVCHAQNPLDNLLPKQRGSGSFLSLWSFLLMCRKLFEQLSLSGALAELTWPVIPNKRHIFRHWLFQLNVFVMIDALHLLGVLAFNNQKAMWIVDAQTFNGFHLVDTELSACREVILDFDPIANERKIALPNAQTFFLVSENSDQSLKMLIKCARWRYELFYSFLACWLIHVVSLIFDSLFFLRLLLITHGKESSGLAIILLKIVPTHDLQTAVNSQLVVDAAVHRWVWLFY